MFERLGRGLFYLAAVLFILAILWPLRRVFGYP
jgi:hypothetical protein